MEIQGKIIAALPVQSGTSKRTGNPWSSQDYVVETHEQYPKKCCFRVFGEDRIKQFNIQVGEEVTVSFDIDCHEYQGRWYNDIRAWNVQRVDPNAVAPAGNQPQAGGAGIAAEPSPAAPAAGSDAPFPPAPSADGDSADDLPF